jgi:hypothetical protein
MALSQAYVRRRTINGDKADCNQAMKKGAGGHVNAAR